MTMYDLRTMSLEDSIVKRSSHGGHTFIEAQPGDGTRYVLCFTDLDELKGASEAASGGDGYVLVTSMADPNHIRSVCVHKNGFIHWTYVAERMGFSTASAVTVSELIGHVLNVGCVTRDEFQSGYERSNGGR